MENPKFTVFTGKDDQFYFRLTARNGEIILSSEGYTSKSGCMNGIDAVKENVSDGEQFKSLTASDGQFYFNLVAKNGETIGNSETYTSESGRDNGIQAVKDAAPDAPVEDTSE